MAIQLLELWNYSGNIGETTLSLHSDYKTRVLQGYVPKVGESKTSSIPTMFGGNLELGGQADNVKETIKVLFIGTYDQTRAFVTTLGQLADKVENSQRTFFIDDFVWLRFRGNSADEVWRTRVTSLSFQLGDGNENAGYNLYGADSNSQVMIPITITLSRFPYWESETYYPLPMYKDYGNPSAGTGVVTIDNILDVTNLYQNYVYVDLGLLSGKESDLPVYPILQVAGGSTLDGVGMSIGRSKRMVAANINMSLLENTATSILLPAGGQATYIASQTLSSVQRELFMSQATAMTFMNTGSTLNIYQWVDKLEVQVKFYTNGLYTQIFTDWLPFTDVGYSHALITPPFRLPRSGALNTIAYANVRLDILVKNNDTVDHTLDFTDIWLSPMGGYRGIQLRTGGIGNWTFIEIPTLNTVGAGSLNWKSTYKEYMLFDAALNLSITGGPLKIEPKGVQILQFNFDTDGTGAMTRGNQVTIYGYVRKRRRLP